MIAIGKENVVRAFYYLMSIDGIIDAEELKKFEELAVSIDASYPDYKEAMLKECNANIAKAKASNEYYEMIVEAFDKKVYVSKQDPLDEVSARLMVWNMYTISFADGDLSNEEKKFINHIIRFLEVDKSVSLEMEQMCKSFSDIEKEIYWAENSNLKYSTVSPIINELKERQMVISRAAKALIEDDMYEAKPIYIGDEKNSMSFGSGMFDGSSTLGETMNKASDAIDKFTNKVGAVAADVGEKSSKVTQEATKQINETRQQITNKAEKLASDISGKISAVAKDEGSVIENTTDELLKATQNVAGQMGKAGKAFMGNVSKALNKNKEK